MATQGGHRGCRTRELLLALTVDDLRRALDEASGDEMAPAMAVLGMQTRSVGRRGPQLLRTRLRSLGHDAAHDVACFLTQPVCRALEANLPEDGPVADALAAGPLQEVSRTWPPGLVRLTLESMWFLGDLDLEQRDRLLPLVDAGDAAVVRAPTGAVEDAPAAAPVAQEAVVVIEQTTLDAAATTTEPSALDVVLADAVGRARRGATALGHLDHVRAALEELTALDPGRTSAWYQYGLVVATLDALGDPSVVRPLPGPARIAFVLGCLRGCADVNAEPGGVALVAAERPVVEELLGRADGEAVAAFVVLSHLHQPKAAVRFLSLAPRPFTGWRRVVDGFRTRVDDLLRAGNNVEAELLLRALEDALWRWSSSASGRNLGLEQEATALLLWRVSCRRRRSDFVGAARLLASLDEAWLTAETRARMAAERALIGAELPGVEALRFPRGEAEWQRLVDRLTPVRRHLMEAVDGDPGDVLPQLLLGMLLYGEGDTSAAAALSAAADQVGDEALAREVRFHGALARLRLLEPGTDEGAYVDMAAALAGGYTPAAEDLASAVVALEAHGSPHAGAFLSSALALAPSAPALVVLVGQRARTGDEDACATAERVALDHRLALSVRFELLDAALEGAGVRFDTEAAARLAGAIDDVLVRAGDTVLDERFADALAVNETLRLALDPTSADALRLEVLRRIGRIEEARAIATALFYRAAGGGLRAFDPADLFDVLVELGLAPAELDDLARLLPSPPDGEEPAARLDEPLHVLFVGGNETQDRYRDAVEAAVAERYAGMVRLTWFLSGWRSNWHTDAARVEAAYGQADVVVLMTFVRTHLGQRVRRSAGEAGLPWVACTGHGREAIERAIDRAVAIAVDRVGSSR